ncbi:hypothetical protein AVEN_1004-1 [Araneus ventricosus]|uniref:Uncharacterized protein n=1 Tax=Araneus ventricosus TaxID=182803 RepID=A0A4Y2RJN5_ARAVE|nr:hypothetical protein AVEN_1004-1 [Araneus ventricosus]
MPLHMNGLSPGCKPDGPLRRWTDGMVSERKFNTRFRQSLCRICRSGGASRIRHHLASEACKFDDGRAGHHVFTVQNFDVRTHMQFQNRT